MILGIDVVIKIDFQMEMWKSSFFSIIRFFAIYQSNFSLYSRCGIMEDKKVN